MIQKIIFKKFFKRYFKKFLIIFLILLVIPPSFLNGNSNNVSHAVLSSPMEKYYSSTILIDSSGIAGATSLTLSSGSSQYYFIGSTAGSSITSQTWNSQLSVINYAGTTGIIIGNQTSNSGSFATSAGNYAIAGVGVSTTTNPSIYTFSNGTSISHGTQLAINFQILTNSYAIFLVGGQGEGNLSLTGFSYQTIVNNTYSEAGGGVIASTAIYSANLTTGSYTGVFNSVTNGNNQDSSIGVVMYVFNKNTSNNNIKGLSIITISNNFNSSSGINQLELTIDSTKYANYINANWSNVYFQYLNGSYIPAWIQSGNSNSSSSTKVWLKLDSIPAFSSMQIQMIFLLRDMNILSSSGPTGVSVAMTNNATSDDGALVFDVYGNFLGNSLPQDWTLQGSASFFGGSSGVQLVPNSANLEGSIVYSQPFKATNVVVDASTMYNGQADDIGIGLYSSGPTTCSGAYCPAPTNGYYATYEFFTNSFPAILENYQIAQTATNQPLSSGQYHLLAHMIVTKNLISMNYNETTNNIINSTEGLTIQNILTYSSILNTNYATFYVGGATGGSSASENVYWIRVRNYIPFNLSFSIGNALDYTGIRHVIFNAQNIASTTNWTITVNSSNYRNSGSNFTYLTSNNTLLSYNVKNINGYIVSPSSGSISITTSDVNTTIIFKHTIALPDIYITSNATLTNDMYCNNLIISTNVTLTSNGYNIYCTGSVNNKGTILTGDSLLGNYSNSIGGSGGGAQSSITNAANSSGDWTQAAGGTGANTGNAGSGSTPSTPSLSSSVIMSWYKIDMTNYTSGAGGQSGGVSPGYGGYGIYIQADSINAGLIISAGTNGTGTCSGEGLSGGGGGGSIILAYGQNYVQGNYDVSGGYGAVSCDGTTNSGNGGNGQVIKYNYTADPFNFLPTPQYKITFLTPNLPQGTSFNINFINTTLDNSFKNNTLINLNTVDLLTSSSINALENTVYVFNGSFGFSVNGVAGFSSLFSSEIFTITNESVVFTLPLIFNSVPATSYVTNISTVTTTIPSIGVNSANSSKSMTTLMTFPTLEFLPLSMILLVLFKIRSKKGKK